MERLREAFFQLKDCKDDTQQRGWAVHDDHHIILGYLKELLQLLVSEDYLLLLPKDAPPLTSIPPPSVMQTRTYLAG